MKFNCTDIHGKQIDVTTPTKDAMIAALENPATTGDKKELAKKILAWYGAELNKPPLTGNSDLEKAAQLMLVDYHATSLWDGSYQFEERPIKGASPEGSAEGKDSEDGDSGDASETTEAEKKTVTVIVNAESGEVLAL